MRRLSRRQFAGSVGAGLLLAPFINMATAHAGAGGRQAGRSGSCCSARWGRSRRCGRRPESRARRINTWSAMTQPLSAVKANVVLVEGMPSGNPNDGHGASDSLTGQGFGYYGQGVIKMSVDQFVAKKLAAGGDQPADRVAAAGRQHQRQRRHLAVLRRRERRQPADHRLAAVRVQHRVRRRAAPRARRRRRCSRAARASSTPSRPRRPTLQGLAGREREGEAGRPPGFDPRSSRTS